VLDMDSNGSLTYAAHEGSDYHATPGSGVSDQFGDVVRPAMMRQWRIAAAWPRRDARRGPQGTRETAPEGKPRVVSIVAIVSSGPSSDTLYRTVPGCHLPVDPIKRAPGRVR